LRIAVLASWGIACVGYGFQVPANRIGHCEFTAAQLKTIQEVITLILFCVFSALHLDLRKIIIGLVPLFSSRTEIRFV